MLIGEVSELVDTGEVPGVEAGEVVFREAVPCGSGAAAGERHFVEGRLGVAFDAAVAFVVDVTEVVPEAIVVIEGDAIAFDHLLGEFV